MTFPGKKNCNYFYVMQELNFFQISHNVLTFFEGSIAY